MNNIQTYGQLLDKLIPYYIQHLKVLTSDPYYKEHSTIQEYLQQVGLNYGICWTSLMVFNVDLNCKGRFITEFIDSNSFYYRDSRIDDDEDILDAIQTRINRMLMLYNKYKSIEL